MWASFPRTSADACASVYSTKRRSGNTAPGSHHRQPFGRGALIAWGDTLQRVKRNNSMADATLVIERTFDATPENVFDAWIDPVQVAKWYGPEGFTNDIHEYCATPGGVYRLTMHSPDGEMHPLKGKFITVERPKKLVFTWQWEGDGGAEMDAETVVTVEFKAMGSKTEMTMTHERLAGEKSKQMHEQGWSSSFTKLEKILA